MSINVNDIPLCEGDMILYDLYQYGPEITIYGIVDCIVSDDTIDMKWIDPRYEHEAWYQGNWKVSSEYIVEIVNTLAPKLPIIHDIKTM